MHHGLACCFSMCFCDFAYKALCFWLFLMHHGASRCITVSSRCITVLKPYKSLCFAAFCFLPIFFKICWLQKPYKTIGFISFVDASRCITVASRSHISSTSLEKHWFYKLFACFDELMHHGCITVSVFLFDLFCVLYFFLWFISFFIICMICLDFIAKARQSKARQGKAKQGNCPKAMQSKQSKARQSNCPKAMQSKQSKQSKARPRSFFGRCSESIVLLMCVCLF